MELSDRNYHKRLIEMCDCYLETDFPSQLRIVAGAASADPEEDAIRHLALAVMYAISEKARKLSWKRKKGQTSITMKNGDEISLPVPSQDIMDHLFNIMKGILHLDGGKIETTLSLGLRNDQIDLDVDLEMEEGKQSLKIKFPRMD